MIKASGYRAQWVAPLSDVEFVTIRRHGKYTDAYVVMPSPDNITMVVFRDKVMFIELNDDVDACIERGVAIIEAIIKRVLLYTNHLQYCRRTYTHRPFTTPELCKLHTELGQTRNKCTRLMLPCHHGRCLLFSQKMVMYCTCSDIIADRHMNEIMTMVGRVLGGGD